MENLFGNLFKLRLKSSNNPTEDYLTELFAYCLHSYPSLFIDFLSLLDISVNKFGNYFIKTQETFNALESHDRNSRPDMVLYLNNNVIFIENKIFAQEGYYQLQRYAEHLDKLPGEKILVYITRDYDPKDYKKLTENCKNSIRFVSLRWYQIYRMVEQHNDNLLIKEFLKFMASLGLSSNNQFLPLDIMTLTNFSRVKKMLDETMDNTVQEKFKNIANGISQNSTAMVQLRDFDRYIHQSSFNNHVWIGFGYWMNAFNEKEYPDVKLVIEVAPKSAKYNEIKNIMIQICESNNMWKQYNLDIANSWAGIQIERSLKEFIHSEDHVAEIQTFFIESINVFSSIKNRFGDLI